VLDHDALQLAGFDRPPRKVAADERPNVAQRDAGLLREETHAFSGTEVG
jgi:hypothetical protein